MSKVAVAEMVALVFAGNPMYHVAGPDGGDGGHGGSVLIIAEAGVDSLAGCDKSPAMESAQGEAGPVEPRNGEGPEKISSFVCHRERLS